MGLVRSQLVPELNMFVDMSKPRNTIEFEDSCLSPNQLNVSTSRHVDQNSPFQGWEVKAQ